MATATPFDIGAARKARAETKDESPGSLKWFGGETYPLPSELPADYPALAAAGQFRAAFEAVFGKDAVATMWTARPSVDDCLAATEYFAEVFGLGDSGN